MSIAAERTDGVLGEERRPPRPLFGGSPLTDGCRGAMPGVWFASLVIEVTAWPPCPKPARVVIFEAGGPTSFLLLMF